ncbi:DNA-directed RNA polymerase subunit beta [Parasponia andersonii]|uniref:DNA-directed RNA polymerase subunit beta n=1 Tax=Parasponia andersonii TaxID=3476 RepID=A0A2P5DAV0_PARAD|nr:DNA-directed RNA polymerase subunit beta [Parasponia andersonii]
MLMVAEKSFILTKFSSCLFVNKYGKRFGIVLAKKKDFPENSKSQKGPIFPLRISGAILAQSAIAVFGLGFIDAGYSGDWSRIGVISKESEDFLKAAAFIVVPLCLFVIVNLPKQQES